MPEESTSRSLPLSKDQSEVSARPSSSVSTTQGTGGNNMHDLDAHDAALLAQFTAASTSAGMSPHNLPQTILDGSLLAQEGYLSSSGFNAHLGNMTHTQLLPLSFLDFPWYSFLPQHQGHQTHPDQFSQIQGKASAAGSSSEPNGGASSIPQSPTPPESPDLPSGRSPTNATASQSLSVSASTSEPNSTQIEPEHAAMADEKRRRNTEASARFRIKKKQKTLNLERTVSDLTGRAVDLEREAADLRRENGWLKEIVILKGSRLAGANLASHIMAESAQQATEQSQREDDSSDDNSSEAEEASTSKGKGKSRKK